MNTLLNVADNVATIVPIVLIAVDMKLAIFENTPDTILYTVENTSDTAETTVPTTLIIVAMIFAINVTIGLITAIIVVITNPIYDIIGEIADIIIEMTEITTERIFITTGATAWITLITIFKIARSDGIIAVITFDNTVMILVITGSSVLTNCAIIGASAAKI